MTQTNWIELKSAGGGFPILLEQFGAYRCFDHHESPPRIVVAIGGESKRRFFASATGQLPRCRAPTIRIQQWTPTTVLVDCELHDLTSLESVKASSQEGSCTQHPLQAFVPRACSQKRLTELSHDIYWQILTPLASIIIIFLEDIGGLSSVIEVIASWMRRSAANPTPSAPRILVLYDCNKELQVQKFTARLRARVVAFVHDLDSESGDMDEGVIFQSTHTFESLRLVSTVAATTDFLQLNIEEAFSFREGNGYAFDGEHVKYLLQAAIRHYCAGNRQQINLISASRLPNPVSDEFEMHLNYFMESCSGVDVDQAKLIASALHVDAHPPGMHHFHADSTFDKLYLSVIENVERRWNLSGFAAEVRNRFITFSWERKEGSSARAHGRLLLSYKDDWKQIRSISTCLACFARSPRHTLQCEHRFCDACVIMHCGPTSPELRTVVLKKCPLCHVINEETLFLRPPTAGTRVLELAGPASSKNELWHFLKQLQLAIELPLPLREHFDIVKSLDIGSFFVHTLFVENWSLDDCKYHLEKAREPKLYKKPDRISFGKNLQWNPKEISLSNGPEINLHAQGQAISNTSRNYLKLPASIIESMDIVVRFFGQCGMQEDKAATASQLVSSLFYIELLSKPFFYSVPEVARVRLMCRVPPGPALIALIKGLQLKNSGLFYRADQRQYIEEGLVTATCLSRCISGMPFSKILSIKLSSLHSKIDVQIESKTGYRRSISHCPYELNDLISDQGLDCVFGRNDHQMCNTSQGLSEATVEEIGRLRDTLDSIIYSYKML